jgi:MFS family permease
MVIAGISGLLCPMATLYYHGPISVLATALFAGWALPGAASLFMGTIPSETVPADIVSTAIGVIVASGVLIGGLLAPSLAGWSADKWGLQAPLLLQGACAVVTSLAAAALKETAPRFKREPAEAIGG